jgi:hypothetical protein
MEQDFQTSFIPKKPIAETKPTKSPLGWFLALSILAFLIMVLLSGGLYFYKKSLVASVARMENNLSLAKNRFEPAKINQLETLDRRLQASDEILSKHIAISPIFEALQTLTLRTIRYTEFNYSFASGKNSRISVKLSGQAVGYRSVALQADELAKNKNLIDPVFSDLSLDEKGNVLFELQFSVDQNFVNYERIKKTESESSS